MPRIDLPLQSDVLLQIIETQTEIAGLGLDLGGVMALAAKRCCRLTNADGAVVELAEGDEMVYRASSGTAEGLLGLRLQRSGSLSGLCVAEGRPLRCDDAETDPRVDRDACRRVGLRSMIVSPLKHGESVVGALKVLSKRPQGFSETEARTLELVSNLVASAMYHAAKYETDELFRLATHDPLTGLANRAAFYDRLRHQVASSRSTAVPFAVLSLDMDGLKPINDQFGHRAGDAAIRALAVRVKSQARDIDITARVGGDEFALMLASVEGPRELLSVRERLYRSIEEPFRFEEQPLKIRASIGIASFPDDGTELEHLIERSDKAMYEEKRRRKIDHRTKAANQR